LLCVVALSAFVATCAAIHSFAPLHVNEVSEKLLFFKTHRAEFDTVFVGSSRTYHGVSPKVFDETLRATGRTTRSFNFAIDGMQSPESLMMVRRIVALRPPSLKRIVLETSRLRVLSNPDPVTPRDIYWHDAEALKYACRKFLADSRPRPAKKKDAGFAKAWAEFTTHLRLFAVNEMNIGRAGLWLGEATSPPKVKKQQPPPLGPDNDGFAPVFREPDERHVKNVAAEMEQLRGRAKPVHQVDPIHRGELVRLEKELAQKQVALSFVATPSVREVNGKLDVPDGSPIFVFDDPASSLYRLENRFDADHLNTTGAIEFTRLLATEFARRLDAAPAQ
jgi:hypothetical protein